MPDLDSRVSLEGAFTTWTYTGNVDCGTATSFDCFAISNIGYLCYQDDSNQTLIVDKTGSNVATITDSNKNYNSTYQAFSKLTSALGTYLIGVTSLASGTTFKVINTQAGTEFTRDVDTDMTGVTINAITSMAISPNGKYVVMWARDSANKEYWVIYEGS